MAKGLRSSTKKANRTQLRSRVFGPVEEARKERLSAKLLELASRPRTAAEEDVNMADEHKGKEGQKEAVRDTDVAGLVGPVEEDIDVDKPSQDTPHRRSSNARRVDKQGRGNARAAMVFPVYKKGRRVGPRRKQRR